jgi:predicted nuclease of predicted toxin-antitoxin system
MKILIDECLPKKLKNALSQHEVSTVPEAGWASKKNGELLALMTNVYEVFITVDANMQHQQKLKTLPIRFIVLSAKNNKLETLLPLMPQIEDALTTIQMGEVRIISEEDKEND